MQRDAFVSAEILIWRQESYPYLCADIRIWRIPYSQPTSVHYCDLYWRYTTATDGDLSSD